jgi:hypothetical protein
MPCKSMGSQNLSVADAIKFLQVAPSAAISVLNHNYGCQQRYFSNIAFDLSNCKGHTYFRYVFWES